MTDFLVIGGGVAGIAAAAHLAELMVSCKWGEGKTALAPGLMC